MMSDAGWRCFIAGFEIDPGGTMPTIEQQLNVLMQQRAQQFIATLTSMDAASHPIDSPE
jgi:hypothetical protein